MSNVFVTGGTGLLGTHLILKLAEKGIRPKALFRTHIPAVIRDKADWVNADISDILRLEEELQGIEYVYHVAGLVSFYKKDKERMHKINVEGTANVVNACLSAGVKKLLHVSSVASLGRIRDDDSINETMQWSPSTNNSEYAKSKFLGELEAWRGYAEGIEVTVVNPSIIIGEHGDWTKGSMQIFESVYNGFPWYTTGVTGYVDANDAAEAMIALMDADTAGERYILNGENISFQEAFNTIAHAFVVKPPSRKVTPLMAGLAWRIEKIKSLFTGKDPLVTKETAATGLAVANFDSSKLLKALPDFKYTPFRESVKRICAGLQIARSSSSG